MGTLVEAHYLQTLLRTKTKYHTSITGRHMYQCTYLKEDSLKKADHHNTQSVTSCLWRRAVDSESVQIMIRPCITNNTVYTAPSLLDAQPTNDMHLYIPFSYFLIFLPTLMNFFRRDFRRTLPLFPPRVNSDLPSDTSRY